MGRKNNYLILIIVIAMSVLVFTFVKYYAHNSLIKITDKYIGSLEIKTAVEELHNRGNGLTQDQYKQILIGMAVYSNLKQSEMDKDKTDPFYGYVELFTTSFRNFVFSYKKGVQVCLDSDKICHEHVKRFLNSFIEFSETLNMPKMFSTYVDKYGGCRTKVHGLYDKDIIKDLSKEIEILVDNEKKLYSMGDIVLGSIFVHVSKAVKHKENNK